MYLSPLDSQTMPYHTIPFKSDSLKSAIYGSLVYSTGTANDRGLDWVGAGQASIYRSHNLGNFQAYYGANITLGTYGMSDFYIHIIYHLLAEYTGEDTIPSTHFIISLATGIHLEVMVYLPDSMG
jgi:hypothetical protein